MDLIWYECMNGVGLVPLSFTYSLNWARDPVWLYNRSGKYFIIVRFWRIKSISALKELKYSQWSQTHNIGIQMKRKELTKPFMMILNWKNPLISMVYEKYVSVVGWGLIHFSSRVTAAFGNSWSPSATCQKTQHMNPMLIHCWVSVCDAGPTLIQHWIRVWCFLVCTFPRTYRCRLACAGGRKQVTWHATRTKQWGNSYEMFLWKQ